MGNGRNSYESAGFCAAIAGVAAVVGSVLVAMGIAVKSPTQDVWAQPWLDVGVGAVALAVLLLGFSVWMYLSSAENPGTATREATASAGPDVGALKRLLTEGYELESTLNGGALPKPEQVADDRLYQWARASWEALREDYPQEAREFFTFGGSQSFYLPGHFMTAYTILSSQDRLVYIRPRLRILERVVRDP
jgi:hypothetical protein